MTVVLRTHEIHSYYGKSHILHGVSLDVNEGEIVTMLGRNGAGKTTTIRSLMGLTPPRRGETEIFGKKTTHWQAHRIAELGVGGGTNTVLEFVGDGAAELSIDERLAVANMAVEAGAETGLFPADETTAGYLEGRVDASWTAERTDPDAEVLRRVRIDLSALPPLVALPHLPGNVVPVDEARGRRIDQVYIGNCANGTMTDLRQAASILGGRTVHPRTRAVVVPATQAIWREAAAEGLLDAFAEAGAMVSTPTCGACFGGSNGVLAAGENAVATTNRNFRGRMGSPQASVYLANAWVAAAAAVAGEIVLAGDTFYDFESKYLGAPGADLVCPADLAPGDLTEMQRLAALAFEAIDGTGLARVDFFLTDDGWVVNEVNTMPGFTPISMYPQMWQATGVSYPELVDLLVPTSSTSGSARSPGAAAFQVGRRPLRASP